MWQHKLLTAEAIRSLIKGRQILLAGNSRLKIYGSLRCSSGKNMKRVHRIFFANEAEALALGYRPCARCKKEGYMNWKKLDLRKKQVDNGNR